MNCDQVKDTLSTLLDGELGEAQAQAARQHLEACAACRAEFRALTRLSEAYQSLPEPEPAEGMEARVLQRIRAHRRSEAASAPRRWFEALLWRPRLAGMAFAGAVALIAVAIVSVRVVMRPETEAPTHSGAGVRLGSPPLPEPMDGVTWERIGAETADGGARLAFTYDAPVEISQRLALRAQGRLLETGIELKTVEFKQTPDGHTAAFFAYETLMKSKAQTIGPAAIEVSFAIELITEDGQPVERLARQVFLQTNPTINGEGRRSDKFAVVFRSTQLANARSFQITLEPPAAATPQTPRRPLL